MPIKLPFKLPAWRANKHATDTRQLKSNNKLKFTEWAEAIRGSGYGTLSDALAVRYYAKVAPLSTAINLIVQSAASIQPLLINADGEVISEHALLDLLQMPNSDSTWAEFWAKSVLFRLLSGNTFWLGQSDQNQPFLSIECRRPQDIQEQQSSQDMFVSHYQLSARNESVLYKRDEDVRIGQVFLNGFHFFDDLGNELWHAKTVNPLNDGLRGLSPLSAIWSEIDQYIQTSTHNLNALKNGFNADVLIKSDDSVVGDLHEDLITQLRAFIGTTEKSRVVVSPAISDVKTVSQSHKDMEFSELKKTVTHSIYNQLHIPLPFVSNDKSTFSNMESSPTQLMDFAVLPHVNALFQELTRFLVPRYPELVDQGVKIWYNQTQIPAIAARLIKQSQELAKIPNTFRRDEIRALVGFDSTGQDDVFIGGLVDAGFEDGANTSQNDKSLQSLIKAHGFEMDYL